MKHDLNNLVDPNEPHGFFSNILWILNYPTKECDYQQHIYAALKSCPISSETHTLHKHSLVFPLEKHLSFECLVHQLDGM